MLAPVLASEGCQLSWAQEQSGRFAVLESARSQPSRRPFENALESLRGPLRSPFDASAVTITSLRGSARTNRSRRASILHRATEEESSRVGPSDGFPATEPDT